MDNELTWREAEDAMERGEPVQVMHAGRLSEEWVPARLRDNEFEVFAVSPASGAAVWHQPRLSFGGLRTARWRRVPKTPRVHELPERWRAVTGEGWSLRLEMIKQLEAALREDELVSLKGVTEEDILAAWDGDLYSGGAVGFALKYLRDRSKR